MLRYRVVKRWRCCRCRVPIICPLHLCKLSILDTAEMLKEGCGLSTEDGKRDLASSMRCAFVAT
jgi:hypothetical protein